MTNLERLVLVLILLVFVANGALYATRVPPYNAPDEPAHANYAREIGEHLSLPVLRPGDWDADQLEQLKASRFPPGSDVSAIRYESHQPPLYYALVAPVARLAAPLGERPQLVALRLATVLLGAVALSIVYRIALLLLPDDAPSRLLAVALAAFIPMHVAVTASVSNDVLAELLASAVLWRSIVAVRDGASGRAALVLGGLSGLAMLTKLSAYAALPVAVIALAAAPPSRLAPRRLVLWGLVVLVLAAPWLLRGALVYGLDDPFGLGRHDEVVVGQTRTGALTAAQVSSMAATLFRSFWGQFGWMGVLLDERLYVGLGVFSGLIGLGIVLWLAPWGGFWREIGPDRRRGVALAATLVAAVALGTLVYNLTYLQPQGRYLFPAMAGIAVLATFGLREIIAPRQRTPIYAGIGLGLATLDLVVLIRFVEPALRP